MNFRRALALLMLGCLGALELTVASAQTVDPAVFGERLQRLTATVESLEVTLASQHRQIEALGNELQRLRGEMANQSGQKPWADDLKRLAEAISDVDRKRVADSEQALKVLNELRKAITAGAEQARTSTPQRPDDEVRLAGNRANEGAGRGAKASVRGAKKAVDYVMKRGETLSEVVVRFNTDAKARGYQAVTVQQVMEFNEITDARRIPEGATIQLPMVSP